MMVNAGRGEEGVIRRDVGDAQLPYTASQLGQLFIIKASTEVVGKL